MSHMMCAWCCICCNPRDCRDRYSRQQASKQSGRVLGHVHAHDRLHQRTDAVCCLAGGKVDGEGAAVQRVNHAGERLQVDSKGEGGLCKRCSWRMRQGNCNVQGNV